MINIIGQYLKDLSIEVPNAPQIFLENGHQKPNIAISIDIDAKKIGENNNSENQTENFEIFEISLKISADANKSADAKEQKKQENILFVLEAVYSGIFKISQIDNQMIEQILLIYCPNLLFPFLRKIIANSVSDAGFPALMLDPIDFGDLYQKRLAAQKQNQEASVIN